MWVCMSSVMVRVGAASELLFVVLGHPPLRTFGLWSVFLLFFNGFFGGTFVGVPHPHSSPLGTHSLLVSECTLLPLFRTSVNPQPVVVAVCFSTKSISFWESTNPFVACSSTIFSCLFLQKQNSCLVVLTQIFFLFVLPQNLSHLRNPQTFFVVCSYTIFFLFVLPQIFFLFVLSQNLSHF